MDNDYIESLKNKKFVINTRGLMAKYKVTRVTIERWRREGLAFKIINNKVFFNIETTDLWMKENKADQLVRIEELNNK
jgi:hypothetical protein